jgi:hypothetical protein
MVDKSGNEHREASMHLERRRLPQNSIYSHHSCGWLTLGAYQARTMHGCDTPNDAWMRYAERVAIDWHRPFHISISPKPGVLHPILFSESDWGEPAASMIASEAQGAGIGPDDAELMRMPRHRPGEVELLLPPWRRPGEVRLMLPPWHGPGEVERLLPPWYRPGEVEQVLPACHRSGTAEMLLLPWPA